MQQADKLELRDDNMMTQNECRPAAWQRGKFVAIPTKPTGNRLLDLLPEGGLRRLGSSSRVVTLTRSLEVYKRDRAVPHVYFPTTVVLGLVLDFKEGRQVEGATVGSEGMMGLPALLGSDFHPFRVVTQVEGQAVQVPTVVLLQEIKSNPTLDRLLLRYTHYRLWCANQTGACNNLHTAQERMARWLLMTHDRIGKDEFRITHEFIAELLGVRRQTVSVVAGALQRADFITYRRGVLLVRDRKGLETVSCECYEALKELYSHIMGR